MPIYYPAVVNTFGAGYMISVPDFPGVKASAPDIAEAVHITAEAISRRIGKMNDEKLDVPQPSRIEDIARAKGSIAVVIVEVPEPSQQVRVNISIDSRLLAEIDAVASNRGRSAFLAEGAEMKLRMGGRRKQIDAPGQKPKRT